MKNSTVAAYALVGQFYGSALWAVYKWQHNMPWHPALWPIFGLAAVSDGIVCYGALRHLGLLKRGSKK